MDLLLTCSRYRVPSIRLIPSIPVARIPSTVSSPIHTEDLVLPIMDHWQLPWNNNIWGRGWGFREVISPLLTRLLQDPGSLEEFKMNIVEGHIWMVCACLKIIRRWHPAPGWK